MPTLTSTLLMLTTVLLCPYTPLAAADPSPDLHTFPLEPRQAFDDSYKIYLRKRNGHACIMSIVFLVLFPLGAIAPHLPLNGVVRRVITRVHAPIQILGLCMMIGAMGLGIDIARNDLHYINPVKAHVALGLLTTSMIIAVQPALGLVHHVRYGRKGKSSGFKYVHRWVGRCGIVMGWVNSWLGFRLVGWEFVKDHSVVRNAVVMGVLGAVWFGLVGWDGWRRHVMGRSGLREVSTPWARRWASGSGVGDNAEKVVSGSPAGSERRLPDVGVSYWGEENRRV
ncbi:uncharacterized protein AB675_5609 [Cyphellophora attinorum]|uniref:Cytochrome b561 domain-containing protein n=1 Tax=Cyphellophora attinorum TaxID=1664694 RepID=A0A0N0NP27_9EURO|nr:uncharacterized protein AB675_5609 [Phialophora attinorum]KPI42059.1 hypothetical protein AB675_5609 [Phialophora attinorum]